MPYDTAHATDVTGMFITILLSLEDLSRFKPQAFFSWLKSQAQSISTSELESLSLAKSSAFNFAKLLMLLGVDDATDAEIKISSQLADYCAQAAWIFFAQRLRIEWALLQQPGPWSGDPRAILISDFSRELSSFSSFLSVEEIQRAQKCFRRQIQFHRKLLPGNCFPQLQVLLEGPTEEILLPHFCRLQGFDLNTQAVSLIVCGGANQVLRRYRALQEIMDIPILVVLDGDAQRQAEVMAEILRPSDRLHVFAVGEIEDLFEPEVFLGYVNAYLQSQRLAAPIALTELTAEDRRTQILDRLWRIRKLGDFDKVGLAHVIIEQAMPLNKVPQEMRELVKVMQNMLES